MNAKRRIIPVLLSLIFIVLLIPVSTVSASETYYLKDKDEYKASELKKNSPNGDAIFVLMKDITLDIDVEGFQCRAIKTADKKSLYIKSEKKYGFSVKNASGVAVSVHNLTVYTGSLTAESSDNNAVETTGFITVHENASLIASGVKNGVYSKSAVSVFGFLKASSYFTKSYSGIIAALYAEGNIIVSDSGELYVTGGDYTYGIYCTKYSVLVGKLTVSSKDKSGIVVNGDLTVSGVAAITVSNGEAGIDCKGNMTVSGEVKVQAKQYGVRVEGQFTMSVGHLFSAGTTGLAYSSAKLGENVQILTPAGGYAGTNCIKTSKGAVADTISIKSYTLDGAVTIPTNITAGNDIVAVITGNAASISSGVHYKWEKSSDKSNWASMIFAEKTYTVTYSDAGYYFRVSVTADGYKGTLVSRECYVAKLPEVTGKIEIPTKTYYVGDSIKANYSGIPYGTMHYQWYSFQQKREGGVWAEIPGEISNILDAPASLVNKFVRLKITIDGYSGELISNAVQIVAKPGPSLLMGDVDLNGISL